jgi:hypothetical protein
MTESAAATTTRHDSIVDTVLVIAAWLVAFALLVLAIAAISGTEPGRERAAPLDRLGRQLLPNNANAKPSGDAMTVANRPDAPLVILAAGTLPIRAADYGRAVIDADPLPKGVEAALIWVRRDEPGRPFEQRLAQDGVRIVPTVLDGNPDWRDDIAFVAVGIKGPMERPWSLHSFRLEPLGVGGIAADILQGWTSLERWDGRSINVLFGGRDEQRAWLPPLAFAASAFAAVVAWLLARRRGRIAAPALLALPFLIGWLVLDVRWQANLAEQAGLTWSAYGGRSLDDRHAAMDDGDLYKFARAAIAKLPETPVRIYATSDFEYFRRRAGYHLYPHNVLAYNWADPSVMQPGDYVFLYQKADVGYDTGRRLLLWKSGPTLPVTPLLAQRGAGLFQVRAADAPAQ